MNTETPTLPKPPNDLVKQIESKVGSIKMLPDIAVRALEIARNPESTVKEFASVIQQDVKLATDVLGMANSVLYSAGRPIANLPLAIARIGFRQTKNLVIASSLSSVMKKMSLEEEWICDVLWKHSVITAAIGTNLSRSLQLNFEGEEFTAGLVHDFGRTLLAAAYPQKYSEFDPLDFEDESGVLEHENSAIGSNHCELGAWFAHQQGLPDVIQEVIRFHHTPELSQQSPRLVALTITADHMANYYQCEQTTEDYDATENPGPAWLEKSGVQDATSRFEMVSSEVLKKSIVDANEIVGLG